jgi:hypothetical protein
MKVGGVEEVTDFLDAHYYPARSSAPAPHPVAPTSLRIIPGNASSEYRRPLGPAGEHGLLSYSPQSRIRS